MIHEYQYPEEGHSNGVDDVPSTLRYPRLDSDGRIAYLAEK
jgi:hypothetical protein